MLRLVVGKSAAPFKAASRRGHFAKRRATTTTTTSTGNAETTVTRGGTSSKEAGWMIQDGKMFAGIATGLAAAGALIEYSPWFKNTREGIAVAWHWNDLSPAEITDVAEAWVWRFWIGLAGLLAGSAATRAGVERAVNKRYGSLVVPFKIPLLVLGGVLGAKLTTSTARPSAELVIFLGRLAEFSIDGLMADLAGRPHEDLAWVRKGVHSYGKSTSSGGNEPIEAVPYEQRSGNVLRDLALVRGDIGDPVKCGPYRHKLLLVRELGRLREQEKLVRGSSTEDSAGSKARFLDQIEKDKRRIKDMCKKLYGIKIGRLFEEIQTEAALRLEELRQEQITLVRSRAPLKELHEVDREKEKLKAQAKLALNVKLSTLTRPSPKWKTVLREMNAASQPS